MHHLFVVRVSKRVYVIPAKLVLDLIGERESRHKAIVDERRSWIPSQAGNDIRVYVRCGDVCQYRKPL